MIFMSCLNDSRQGVIIANSKDLQVGLLPYNDLGILEMCLQS